MVQDVDDLIASLYEAACGRASWHLVLHVVANLLDCLVVQIIGVDVKQNRLKFIFEGGDGAPEGVIDYAGTHHCSDPHVRHLLAQAPDTLVDFSRSFDAALIDRHPFYQDYLITCGVRQTHAAKLYQDEATVVFLGLHRAVGMTAPEGSDWEVAQRLCFHLTRAMRIYCSVKLALAEAVMGRETLDRLAVPVLLVDEQRQVMLQNRAAVDASGGGWPLHVNDLGRLSCSASDADAEVTLALRDLQLSSAPGVQHGPGRERVVVRLPVSGKFKPLLACFLALRSDSMLGAFGRTALAMLLIHDPNRPTQIDPFVVAAAFDLTPAEARVAVALAGGSNPKEIARHFGVSFNTVRTQVQAVHAKFGVSRTTELVARIHSVSFGALR